MERKVNILYIGRHPEITTTVTRLINNETEGWMGTGTTTDTEAKALFTANSFDIVLLGNGITDSEEQQLRAFFCAHKPAIKIVQHYGGGSGLLKSEILIALSEHG